MHEPKFYEYAIIRLVPRVERHEFLNVGLILFSKEAKYLKARTSLNEEKLSCFDSELDLQEISQNLQSFSAVCSGHKSGGPMAHDDLPSRFRWLTAMRSSSIQTSRPHVGSSRDLDATFERLFKEMVL
ncbi:DUF3037 domain-containing protein [Cryomorpha ignava]|uniref:DUF3037 domain-containing protein n=1 Tax=Cryomorpha ignava TaxID=101383 RepID=A0A7K3WUU1_9FLAO|nr:DUF3037 domain-containing protein [Cryomorpha ignava]NEN25449.1 DUF3037 domain-containing protein [Cryomorpha ignava]